MWIFIQQGELERLNKASEEINKLELELDVSTTVCSLFEFHWQMTSLEWILYSDWNRNLAVSHFVILVVRASLKFKIFQDARASFRQALTDSTHQLNALAKKLGSCVEKARPYYDARMKAKEVYIKWSEILKLAPKVKPNSILKGYSFKLRINCFLMCKHNDWQLARWIIYLFL